jgi:pimeloyl-ACP methyl ester carboxylesterase
MNELSIEKAVVVGHSMGGIVAANLAAEHGDRVVASVWIGPVYPSSNVSEVFDKRIQLVEEKGMEPLANTIPDAATGAKASPLAKAFVRELLLTQDPRGYVSNCRVIASANVPDYKSIRGPVLILAGEEDKSAPLEGSKKMFSEIGTEEKKLEILKGVGHWHCIEVRHRLLCLVQRYLTFLFRLWKRSRSRSLTSITRFSEATTATIHSIFLFILNMMFSLTLVICSFAC